MDDIDGLVPIIVVPERNAANSALSTFSVVLCRLRARMTATLKPPATIVDVGSTISLTALIYLIIWCPPLRLIHS